MRFWVLLLALSSSAVAAENCPWLNAATAAGVLGGPVTGMVVKRAPANDDASCEFTDRAGSVLRIEVETMASPAKDFASYAARCHSAAAPLKAIGNQALACGGAGAEQVIGRVRNRAFVLRISAGDGSFEPGALREKARKVAEQVAGILF